MAAKVEATTSNAWSKFSSTMKQVTTSGNPVMDPPIRSIITHLDRLSPLSSASGITDIGCGNGAVFSRLLDPSFNPSAVNPSAKLFANDFSQGMIDQLVATQRAALGKDASSPWSRVEGAVLDAQSLSSIPDNSFSHATSSFALFMVPDYAQALKEAYRVLKPGGVLALSSHKHNEWMDCVRGFSRNESRVLPTVWTSTEGIETLLRRAGYESIGSEEVDMKMIVNDGEESLASMIHLLQSMPPVQIAFDGFTEERRQRASAEIRDRIIERSKGKGSLDGVAIVAWAKKPE